MDRASRRCCARAFTGCSPTKQFRSPATSPSAPCSTIFPFLIFLTAVAGFFGNDYLAEDVVTYLLSVAPHQLVQALEPEIRSILTTPRTGLLSLSAVLTIWSAMGGVNSIRVGLNRAYDLRDTRKFWWLYLQNVLFIIGATVFLLAFAVLIVLAPVVINAIDAKAPGFRQNIATVEQLRYPIAIILLTLGLLLCHRVLPAKRLTVLEVLPGVVLTVITWVFLSSAFSIYLVNFS